MSWIEKIKTDYIITCGDGKSYKVKSFKASFATEYNVTVYDFPGVAGSFADRRQPKARRYNIEIHIDGEDNLDVAGSFADSADHPGKWTVQHPMYGSLNVQPFGLVVDDTVYNDTMITGTIIETINMEGAQSTVAPQDKILADKATCDDSFANSYAANVKPGVAEKQQLTTNATNLYSAGRKAIIDAQDYEDYLNAFNTAQSYINRATQYPLDAARQLQNMIEAPAKFKQSVDNRINTLATQLTNLRSSVHGITKYSLKKTYEMTAAAVLSSMALATVVLYGKSDYLTRDNVLRTITTLIGGYNGYISDLDLLQSSNGGAPGAFIPDAPSLFKLGSLISFTVSNLFAIAQNSKQQRSIILEDDSCWLLLAKRFYGLQPDDSTIEQIMNDNNAGLNEMLIVPKGRRLVYYV